MRESEVPTVPGVLLEEKTLKFERQTPNTIPMYAIKHICIPSRKGAAPCEEFWRDDLNDKQNPGKRARKYDDAILRTYSHGALP